MFRADLGLEVFYGKRFDHQDAHIWTWIENIMWIGSETPMANILSTSWVVITPLQGSLDQYAWIRSK